MAISVDYSLFADMAISEEGSGKKSLIGIFEGVYRFYPVIPTLAFFCQAKGEPGVHKITVKVVAVEGSGEGQEIEIAEMPAEILVGPEGKSQILMNFVGLPVIGNRLDFLVHEDDKKIYQAGIEILEPSKEKV